MFSANQTCFLVLHIHPLTASISKLQASGKNRTNFGTGTGFTTGKRQRKRIGDILANVRDGFAKRRARIAFKGDASRLDVSVVREFGDALGVKKNKVDSKKRPVN